MKLASGGPHFILSLLILAFRLAFTEGAVNCSDAPARPANGQRSGSGTTFGSIVTYTCDHGYSPSTQGPNKITLTCMANGSWNGSAPQCNAISCGEAPVAPANGTRSGSGTTFGSTVTYTCNHGYSTSAQGPNRVKITCMANGRWNGSTPKCYIVSCLTNLKDLPAKPANSQRYISSTTFGSTVTYSCDPGYKLIGRSTVTCLASGKWNTSGNVVQCIASCTKPCQNRGNCTAPDTCTCDVRWTGMQCKTALRVPSQVTGVSLSKVVGLRQPALRVTWTAPQSDRTISRYKVQYRRSRDALWGSEKTISGSPPPTSTILMELDAGTEYSVRVLAVSAVGPGNWSVVQTERTDRTVTCGDAPPAPANAQGHNGTTVACMANGSWNGTAPQCYAIRCLHTNKLPAEPANGQRNISGASFGSTVTYSCDAGYKLMGPSTVTCLANRKWNTSVDAVHCISNTSCTTPCENGGTCTAPDTCTCDVGWTGMQCETALPTPQLTVSLTKSALHSLAISWSVMSSQDVTSYIVFWLKESGVIGKSDALNGIMFTIVNLLSNTAYHVVVQASGPLGSVNSTSKVFYTTPNKVKASLSVLVLPKQILQVSWEPADDAEQSPISYIVYATMTGMEFNISTSVAHSMTMANLTGLPQYSAGTVSVWAKNPGARSKPATSPFRMVNIVTNVTGVSAEWVDARFSSLRVTVPEEGTYRVSYSAVNKSNAPKPNVLTTDSSSQVANGFRPDCFYTVLVEPVPSDSSEVANGGNGIGIGIGICGAVAVAVVIILFLLGLCCCWLARRRRYKKDKTFLHFSQPWTLDNPTVNEPVAIAMADVTDPSAVDVKEHISLQVEPEPDDENADALANEPNPISKRLFPAHVRELHRNREEGFEREFGNVCDDPNGSDSIANQNKDKNRYLNTNTFDHSRVILKVPDENGSDYINASYIEGYGRSGHYIAAQGPKLEEVSIFWQMIMEHKPAVVVMLTNVEENGKRKCEQYWNTDLNKPFDAGRGSSVVTTGFKAFADYEVRNLTFKNSTDRPHKVTHFQYTSWPDHGVPLHPSSLVKFAQEVRKVHNNSQAPMVVHCSAGVGRTGTFITLDAMMERLKERDDLNICEFVNEMRTRRKQMVQTMDQYALIHDALSDFITCGDTSVLAHELRHVIGDMDKKDGAGKSGFENQFEFMGSVCKMPVGEDGDFAKKSVVARRNRYKDKYPYSTDYLHIAGRSTYNAAEYINATMMASYSKRRGFVAAQSPLESTRTDVWELIWQFRTKTVVLLGPLKEGKKIMCSQFWPTESAHSNEYGHFVVTFAKATPKPDWKMTVLQVTDKNRSYGSVHEVTLFHFLAWHQDGHPPIDSMLKMMGEVDKKQRESKAPLMVMCDDGMSRTGVFITCMSEIERVKVEGAVDIFQTVKTARAQRPHMVFTSNQYKLCFEILQSYLDSFDTYANFKAV